MPWLTQESCAATARQLLVLAKFVQPPGMALGFRRIHRRDLATESVACRGSLVRGLDTANTTPALASPGFDLTHILNLVVGTAVIAELGLIRHGSSLSEVIIHGRAGCRAFA